MAAVGTFEDDDACADDPNPDPNCDSGPAYIFPRDDNGTPLTPSDDHWVQKAKLKARTPRRAISSTTFP